MLRQLINYQIIICFKVDSIQQEFLTGIRKMKYLF
jgi:hypothetical protein